MTLEEAARNYAECLRWLDKAEHDLKSAEEYRQETGRAYDAAEKAMVAAKADLLKAASP